MAIRKQSNFSLYYIYLYNLIVAAACFSAAASAPPSAADLIEYSDIGK